METKARTILGVGHLAWNGSERRSDRYGLVFLLEPGEGDGGSSGNGPDSPGVALDRRDDGAPGKLYAVVTDTRKSEHIGGLAHGIYPSLPEAGEEILLGEGTLFFGGDAVYPSAGVKPSDNRLVWWLDPHALYRCHSSIVRLAFERS